MTTSAPRSASPLTVTLPDWIDSVVDWTRAYRTDAERVALAVALARENVERRTGGPFGAAVFEAASGRLVSVGVNLVRSHTNAALHAEVVALMFAQHARRSFTLAAPPCEAVHELATSCAPCAMCLGAIHWSGVTRVLAGAMRDDALAVGFDEGPVFPESLAYLERGGIVFVEGIGREAARAVLDRYVELGIPLYNS